MNRTRVAALVLPALVAGAFSPIAGRAASAAPAATTCLAGANDFDQNGGTDTAIGGSQQRGGGPVLVRMKVRGGIRNVTIHPPTAVYSFGDSLADVNLAGASGPSDLCSVLAIAGLDSSDTSSGRGPARIYLYRWNAATSRFALLTSIPGADIFPDESLDRPFTLAGQTVGSNSAADRAPVLWVGAADLGTTSYPPDNPGALARLTLDRDGSIATKHVAVPGRSPRAEVPLSASDSVNFGRVLQGTSSSTRVIVGAPFSTVDGHKRAGAVVVYNYGGTSQLLTQNTPGVPGSAENYDHFGLSIYLSTVPSAAASAPVSLFIGSPGESIGSVQGAGSALQLRYSSAGVSTSGIRFWYEGSTGVAGAAEQLDYFGSSFEALTVHGADAPKFIVGAPNKDVGDRLQAGVVDVLGDGRSFTAATGTRQQERDRQFYYGDVLGSWPGVTDAGADDPDPAPPSGQWSRWLLVSDYTDLKQLVEFGLPAGTFTAPVVPSTITGDVFLPAGG